MKTDLRNMSLSGMRHSVALVDNDVSEQRIASIIRAKRIGDIGTMVPEILFLRSVLQLLITANVISR
jgi:hypothetical protein